MSDCPQWGTISEAFAAAWPEQPGCLAVRELADQLTAENAGQREQIDQAAQLVREQFRLLTVEGELDGQAPAPPGIVARHRYGDARDLAFLLMHLLKALDVEARLVLVNSIFGQSLAAFLPAPGLFDHVLVEYAAGGETRWIDAARPRRAAGNYGVGLRLAAGSLDLAATPASLAASTYESEGIYFD